MFDPKQAGEEADRMIAELNQQRAPEVPVEHQESEDAAITGENIDTPPVVTDVAAERPVAASEDSALAELKRQLEAAEQRWKVLQGMIVKKDEALENMRVLLAQMNSPPATPAPPHEDPTPIVSESDQAAYGDFVGVIERISTNVATRLCRAIIAEELGKLRPSIDKVEQDVQNVQASNEALAYDRFIASLSARVPDWEVLNTDPGFLNWLDQVDEFAGAKRITLLRDAFSKNQALRVAKFFEAYKESIGNNLPATPSAPKADVKQFVTPARSRTTSTPSEQSAKQWSRADIRKLYDDKMRGVITQKVFDERERDLFKAQREGRVVA